MKPQFASGVHDELNATERSQMEKKPEQGELVVKLSGTLSNKSSLISRGLSQVSNLDLPQMLEFAKALTSSLHLDEILRTTMKQVDDAFHADCWSLLLLDESKQELYCELFVGNKSQEMRDRRIPLGRGILGMVAQEGTSAVVPCVQNDSRFIKEFDGYSEIEIRSIVAVPLRTSDRCLGVIQLINYIGAAGFSEATLSSLQTLADFVAIAIKNARYVSAIHRITITDDATGLYNSRHLGFILDAEFCRSERYGYEFCLLSIDLQHLRNSAATTNYSAYGALLRELGKALQEQMRLIDYAFYLENGEFFLLLPQTDKQRGSQIAQRLHQYFRETSWMGQSVYLPARVGIASSPVDGRTKTDLLRSLNEAMYLLKKSSHDGVISANVGIL